jgi:hypothetical protein
VAYGSKCAWARVGTSGCDGDTDTGHQRTPQ